MEHPGFARGKESWGKMNVLQSVEKLLRAGKFLKRFCVLVVALELRPR